MEEHVRKNFESNFLEKAKIVHGDKYDYSKVKYKDSVTEVTIICPDHGPFDQVPASHQNGSGCKECSYIFRGKKRTLNSKDYSKLIFIKHSKKFTLKEETFSNSQTKAIFTCKFHGDFQAVPAALLNLKPGNGCDTCRTESMLKPDTVFYVMADDDGFVKIGLSHEVRKRLIQNRNTYKRNLHIRFCWGGSARELVCLEKEICEKLAKYAVIGKEAFSLPKIGYDGVIGLVLDTVKFYRTRQ